MAVITGRAIDALSQAATAFASILSSPPPEPMVPPATGVLSHYDRMIDGLNRLPRPCLALGTLGLFVYAMAEPEGFSRRMRGLAEVPEPLWWLLGAVVSFHFGAREAYYLRGRRAGEGDGPPLPPPPSREE